MTRAEKADKQLKQEYKKLHSWRRYFCCFKV